MTERPEHHGADSSERRIAINAGSQYAALALSIAARFFITPYLVRSVGNTQFGLQVLGYQLTLFLSLIADGMNASYFRYAREHYARRDYEQMNDTLSAGLLIGLCSASLVAVGSIVTAIFAQPLFGLADVDVGTARAVLLITAFAAAARIPLWAWVAPTQITQRFYLQSLTTTLHIATLIPAVLVIFHFYQPSIVTWVALDHGLYLLYFIVIGIPPGRRILPSFNLHLRRVRSWSQVKPLVTFGSLRVLGELAFLLYFATDSVIISNLDELGPAMIVYFAIAQRWVPQILSLLMAFLGVLTPLLTGDFAVGNFARMRNTYVRAVRYCFILALYPCVVLIIFADPFLRYWMGPDYAEVAAPVMRLIMLGFIPAIPGHVAIQVLIACARMGRHVTVSLIGGFLNIALSVYLVKVAGLGLYGVAIGSVVTLCLSYATNTPLAACRAIGLPVRTLLRDAHGRSLLGALPLALAGAVALRAWPPHNLFIVFVEIGLCGLVYAAGVWRISLTPGDRSKLREGIARTVDRLRSRPGAPA
ncbi:MAG: hypothetical protein K8T26_20215 [Lentisphaerae bacterium]|nr:hypothetical protein [Lentisphaerota bacterium]